MAAPLLREHFRIAEFAGASEVQSDAVAAPDALKITRRFTFRSRRFPEIRNSSLISADQRELDPLPHGIDAFGADTNAVAEMPFHRFCLGASAMADARPATAAFLT